MFLLHIQLMQSALLVLWQKTSGSYDGGNNENCSAQSNPETKNNMDVTCALDNNQIKSRGEPEIPKLNFSFPNPDSPRAGCSSEQPTRRGTLDVLLLTK